MRRLAGEAGRNGREEGILTSRADRAGYVWQNPANQIVTDRVEYEIVFGLENIGTPEEAMHRRLAEMVTFFGLEDLLGRDTMELSGGEMQTLNVASVLAMNPDLLLLDEPTSQLDPVAARKFFQLLGQINEELGITIVIVEQRLEDVVMYADRMVFLDSGKCVAGGTPSEVWDAVKNTEMISFFPSYTRCHREYSGDGPAVFSKKSARKWFEESFAARADRPEHFCRESGGESRQAPRRHSSGEDEIRAVDLWFRYDKRGRDVLKECSLSIPVSACTCLAGGNGSGKSTLLEVFSGRYRPYRGKLKNLPENTVLLPQQPRYLFLEDSLGCYFERDHSMAELAEYFGIISLAGQHPADLSGGELQRAALSYILSREAGFFLLDEPTKGMDFINKRRFGELLKKMKRQGKTIQMVSHDMEFAARYADRMALMFRGKTEFVTDTRNFFEENQFYTTGINRIARGVSRHIITQEDVGVYAEKKSD